jgi:hypothetical protein
MIRYKFTRLVMSFFNDLGALSAPSRLAVARFSHLWLRQAQPAVAQTGGKAATVRSRGAGWSVVQLPLYFVLTACVLTATSGQAQILEPVRSNPAVNRSFQQRQQAETALWETLDLHPRRPSNNRSGDCNFDVNIRYAVAGGDPIVLPIDTINKGGGIFEILSCHSLGVLTPVGGATMSHFYAANTGTTLAQDTACFRYCNADNTTCDTVRFPITVKRGGLLTQANSVTLNTGGTHIMPFDTSSLVGQMVCDFYTQFDAQLGKVLFTDNNEMVYQARRFAGPDTIVYIYCDEHSICDSVRLNLFIKGDTLGLPFYDEFSYNGPYPNPKLWLDDDAFVNYTFAYQPVGLGVATLDGLKENGNPWGVLNKGKTDALTSAYLDMSGLSNQTAYLSFYAQPGGLCRPVEAGDSLVLQFKYQEGVWVSIKTIDGVNPGPGYTPEWVYVNEPITDGAFKYNGFQFRLVAYGDQTGITDPWHIDYVRLATTQQATAQFGDVAFAQLPPGILRRYSSMPWRQLKGFEDIELRDSLDVALFNHFPAQISITESRAALKELNSSVGLFNPPFVLTTGNFDPGPTNSKRDVVDYTVYKDLLNSSFAADVTDLDFELQYTLVNNSQENQPVYARNDTATLVTRLSNYMSYDDGSAERVIVATGVNTQLALEYKLHVADSLRAIQMQLSRINQPVTGQQFRLRVWVDTLDLTPEYDRLVTPHYADTYFDTLQGFTTYPLDTPLFIPPGRFYIGWQQLSNVNNPIPVGFDMNYPTANRYIHFFDGGSQTWTSMAGNATLPGAPMLRAVLGDETPKCTPCVVELDEVIAQNTVVYPNPTSSLLRVQSPLTFASAAIIAADGRVVYSGAFADSFDVSALPAGWYWLRMVHPSTAPVIKQFLVQR